MIYPYSRNFGKKLNKTKRTPAKAPFIIAKKKGCPFRHPAGRNQGATLFQFAHRPNPLDVFIISYFIYDTINKRTEWVAPT